MPHPRLNAFGYRRRLNEIRASDIESGIACVAIISCWHGNNIDIQEMRRRFTSFVGATEAPELLYPASMLDLSGRVLSCTLQDVRNLALPCILLWELRRFVVLEKVSGKKIVIFDPFFGRRIILKDELSKYFSGVAIELEPNQNFKEKKPQPKLAISSLWKWTADTKSAFRQGLVLSLFLQILTLIAPLYIQVIIDRVISSGDFSLLAMLALTFCILAVFGAAATVTRGVFFQYLSNALAFVISNRLHNHLCKLPIGFFQQRTLGQIQTRFRSADGLRLYINNVSIAAVVDGGLLLIMGVFMVLYAWKLAILVFAFAVFYLCVRFYMSARCRNLFAEVFETEGREASQFLETMRAIQTIKVASLTEKRQAGWQNLCIDKLNAAFKFNNVVVGFQALATMLTGITDVLVIYMAAMQVIAGTMTIGVVTAFLAYKLQFFGRLTALSDQMAQYNMLQAQFSRISEIAFSEIEPAPKAVLPATYKRSGKISLKDLTFRYGPTSPSVLEKINLSVRSGEFVAIVGRSGSGKSTILKLLMGLYVPENGEIHVDGLSLSEYGPRVIRDQLGSVMQEDVCFTGTVADNISLFDDKMDMEKVKSSAKLAQFDEVVMAMPYRYDTLLGDLGTSLSSGQKQRLLIARALYRSPAILVMDEGTANLDKDCEETIIANIKALPMTRILVAHSARVAAAADSVYEIRDRGLVRVDPREFLHDLGDERSVLQAQS
ncbi:MAG TPA: peptidase domain-containing ABC transporter [Rhizomicrobium sp.]|nr:peptidase domain-containing ABC transporter [Rhizomicrobium sp.]